MVSRAPTIESSATVVALYHGTLIAATLGQRHLHAEGSDVEKIKRLHLLLAFYNAMQPGCSPFGLGPGRSAHPAAAAVPNSLPTAILAGSTAAPMTCWARTRERCARRRFAARRGSVRLAAAAAQEVRLVRLAIGAPAQVRADLLCTRHVWPTYRACRPRVLVLVHELPENSGLEITAINFGDRAVNEAVPIRGAAPVAKRSTSSIASADVGYRGRRQPAVCIERIRRQGVAD